MSKIKVAILGATGAVGRVGTVNIAASGPSIVIDKPVRSMVPTFLMEKSQLTD